MRPALPIMEEEDTTATCSCCCPVPFSSSPLHRVPTTTANSIFGYDSGLLSASHTALDVPWGRSLSKTTSSNRSGEEKPTDEEGDKGTHQCFEWKIKMPTCSFCGIICNPLLTSRLALMGLLAVLLILMTVLTWVFTSTNVQHSVGTIAAQFRHELLLRMKVTMATVLQGQSATATSLGTYFSSTSQGYLSSFAKLQEQVRPVIFVAFSVLSRSAHISFFGNNGLFLSYGADSSGTYLLYATDSYLYPAPATGNVSQAKEVAWNSGENIRLTRPWYRWYRQGVNESTGLPIGVATPVTPIAYWDEEPIKSVLRGHKETLTWGLLQDESLGPLFTFLSSTKRSSFSSVGAISVGTPFASIQELLDEVDVRGGAAFLATPDGRLVAQTGIRLSPNKRDNVGQEALPLATESNNALVAGAATFVLPNLASLLGLHHDSIRIPDVQVEGKLYMVDSAPLQVGGVTMICVIILPHEIIWGLTDKRNHTTLVVLVALATCMGLVGCFFVVVLTKGVSNEMRLRAALIQQLEETKKAETKSSHKSLVFANMSHDLRTPLAAILGLIDLSLPDTSEHSELESNLLQMKSCATNLLGILNTILDMSKIEAGKLLLQESNFDLVNALEEVVDTFSVVGLKKGIEVALDLSDGSVEKATWVVGDVGRIKQIMANLLSNGVKFTTEGHVVLRAWVKPLNPNPPLSRFNYRGRLLPWPLGFLRSSSREKEICKLIEGFSKQDQNGDYVQIVFEVDDTGRGIPKERWKSVFENFVQVESSGPRSYDGTGLGLGIVRSLVRLMGGDIAIIDKDEPGEPGTRFHFNLIFKRCKQAAKHDVPDIKLQDGASLHAAFGVKSMLVPYAWHLRNSGAPHLFGQDLSGTGFNSPSVVEGVHVLLAMQGQAGKKVAKRWMERRGLQVWMIRSWEEFLPAVQIIKQEICSESLSMSGTFDPIPSDSHYLCEEWLDEWAVKGLPRARSTTGASMHLPPEDDFTVHFEPAQSLHTLGSEAHLLLVVDVTMVMEPLDAVCANLENTLLHDARHLKFKVVWLVNASTPSNDIQYLRSRTSVCHLVLHKPLYASRLRHVWCLLEELAGYRVQEPREGEEAPHMLLRSREKVDMGTANSLYTSLSCMNTFHEDRNQQYMTHTDVNTQIMDQLQMEVSDFSFSSVSRLPPDTQESQKRVAGIHVGVHDNKHVVLGMQENTTHSTIQDQLPSVSPGRKKVKDTLNEPNNALTAMHVLVAEDNPILQRLAKTQLIRLGATVECVDNGAEAARLVLENLYKSKVSSPEEDASVLDNLQGEPAGRMKNRPFDLVLMDCEMPILNGYEATQRIRSEEGRYGVRTPVIALTAHAMSQDEKKCIEAGMDFYLTKPLAVQALLNAVSKITGRHSSQGR